MNSDNAPVRLLLVDEDPLYRCGMAKVLERHDGFVVAGQARTGAEALDIVRRERPDIVLMDLRLGGMDGIATARAICEAAPEVRVAILTASRLERDVIAAVEAGAHGYITKDINVEFLVDAIRKLAAGRAVFTPGLPARLFHKIAEGAGRVSETEHDAEGVARGANGLVTGREREVLELLVAGATNRDIARELVIAENTVKVHLRNILEKLQLRNRQQAAAYAISSGIVPHWGLREAGARRRASAPAPPIGRREVPIATALKRGRAARTASVTRGWAY